MYIYLGLALLTLYSLFSNINAFASNGISGAQKKKCLPAEETINEFYQFHLLHGRTTFTKENTQAKKNWFTERLFNSLIANRTRAEDSIEVPYLSGDPFTYSMEYPKTFSIVRSVCKEKEATVKVVFDDIQHIVVVNLVLEGKNWKIDNLHYRNGRNLLTELQK